MNMDAYSSEDTLGSDRPRIRRKSHRGVTLIEFVVSATIFAMVASAVLTLMGSSTVLIGETELSTQAEQIAFSVLEQQKDRPFGQLVPGLNETLPAQRLPGDANEAIPTVQVIALPGTASDRLVEVRVTVTWKSRNRNHSKVASALVANLPR
jgi:prepilin-type N-terminal cleavage/methylation domain-containing protein